MNTLGIYLGRQIGICLGVLGTGLIWDGCMVSAFIIPTCHLQGMGK